MLVTHFYGYTGYFQEQGRPGAVRWHPPPRPQPAGVPPGRAGGARHNGARLREVPPGTPPIRTIDMIERTETIGTIEIMLTRRFVCSVLLTMAQLPEPSHLASHGAVRFDAVHCC